MLNLVFFDLRLGNIKYINKLILFYAEIDKKFLYTNIMMNFNQIFLKH